MWTPRWSSRPPGGKKGFVLVAVLMSVTILVTGALAFAWFSRMELRRSEAVRFSLVARSVAQAALHEVQRGLVLDTNDYDSFLEPWFGAFPLPMGDGVSVTVRLTPQNGALPANHLFLPDGTTLRREMETPWKRLWEEVGRPDLTASVLDFFDSDRTPRPGGSEAENALNRAPSAVDELRLVPGIDENLYYGNNEKEAIGLDRLLTVNSDGKINLNVAPPEVLALLDESLSGGLIGEIVEKRAKEPVEGWDDLLSLPGFPSSARPRMASLVSFTSSHFLVDVEVRSRNLVRHFQAVLAKKAGRCAIVVWKEM